MKRFLLSFSLYPAVSSVATMATVGECAACLDRALGAR